RAASAQAGLKNGEAKWGYSLPANADDLKIEVLDANGVAVRTIAASGDDIKAGDHTFTWDGKDDSGAAQAEGTYKLRITAKDAAGQAIASTTYIQGKVTGVEQADGQGLVTISGAKVPMSAISS